MIPKDQFVQLIEKLKDCDERINSAETKLGFEISTSGTIAELWEIIYEMFFFLSNEKNIEKTDLFDDLGRILFLPGPVEEIEKFYDKYFKEEFNA